MAIPEAITKHNQYRFMQIEISTTTRPIMSRIITESKMKMEEVKPSQ